MTKAMDFFRSLELENNVIWYPPVKSFQNSRGGFISLSDGTHGGALQKVLGRFRIHGSAGSMDRYVVDTITKEIRKAPTNTYTLSNLKELLNS